MHIAPTELNWSTVAKNAEVGHARSSATCSIVDLLRIDWLRTLQRTRTQQANSSSYDVTTPIGIHVFRVIFQSSSFQFMWCEWGSMEAPTTTSVDDRTRFVVVCSIAEQRRHLPASIPCGHLCFVCLARMPLRPWGTIARYAAPDLYGAVLE